MLGETLALAHPLIPFVTEEIWSHVPGADGLLMARRYPTADEALSDPGAEAQLAARDRGRAGAAGVARQRRREAGHGRSRRGSTATATRRRPSTWPGSRGSSGPPTAATRWRRSASRARRWRCSPPTRVDLEAEQRRAQARRKEIEAEIARAEGKLANQGFVAKAPEAVVQAERDKLARLREELAEL